MFKVSMKSLHVMKKVLLLLMGLVMLASGQAFAAEAYKLGPGDVLAVTVQRHPEYSSQPTVNPAGKIRITDVGDVSVNGKTVDQVAKMLTRLLDRELVRPEVSVTLFKARPRQVSVMGTVAKPGVYDTVQGWHITEALAVAGGLTVRPEMATATLRRADGRLIPLDLQRIFRESDQPARNGQLAKTNSANLLLQNGDVITFATRAIQVSINGAIIRPNSYDVLPETGIVEAVTLAGGATPRAALSRARITHADGTSTLVNLHKAITEGDAESNIKVKAGDTIFIPEATERVAVRGAVIKPGYYDIPDGTTLRVAEAVALAGGITAKAALTRVAVEHADGSATPVNLYKVTALGQRDQDLKLASGDIVTVPESRGITVLGEVKTPGTLNIEAGTGPRISDVLAQAGGLTVKPQAAQISVSRTQPNGDVKILNIDPVRLLEGNDASQNASIQEGDLITIGAVKSQTVFVSGEVKTQGPYELQPGDGVPELIARAGGATEEAALKLVTVTKRNDTKQVVDVFDAVNKGGNKPDLQLQGGDFIVVPKNPNRVLVMAAVNKPGNYAMPENEVLTVGKALALAGGTKDRAKMKEIAILRRTPTGAVQRHMISLDQTTSNGQLAINQPLQPGDVVYVPEGKIATNAWQSIIGSIGVLAAIL